MITIGSFKDMSDEYDEIWIIVRSLKSTPYVPNTQVFHVPALSPSPDLFNKYLTWRDNGEWNEDTFQNKYVPQFLYEMYTYEAQQALNTLIEHGKTHKILLVCYCKDESMCHRSIVMGIIQGICNTCDKEDKSLILSEFENDYSKYYEQYLKFDNKFLSGIQRTKWKAETTFYLLVAGSRGYSNYQEMCQVLDFLLKNQVAQHNHIVIVSGKAKGADELAERYAHDRGYGFEGFEAKWNDTQGLSPIEIGYRRSGQPYRKRAGYERNERMHLFISAPSDKKRGCVCFWDMRSPGTKHNFKLAYDYGNPIRVFNTFEHKFLTDKEIEGYA